MKLLKIISEINYRTFEAMVKVKYKTEDNSSFDDALRALPGVTTVTKASSDAESKTVNYKIKVISQKEPTEAFEFLKKNATAKYSSGIEDIEIGEETIEEK